MKKLLAVALVAAFATTASAAQLSLRFTGNDTGGGFTDNTAEVTSVGGTVSVDIVYSLDATEAAGFGVGTVIFNMTTVPEDSAGGVQGDLVENASLVASAATPVAAGWQSLSVAGTVGGLANQVSLSGEPGNGIEAAGEFVLGSFQISANALGTHEIYINRAASLLVLGAGANAANFGAYANVPNSDNYNEYNIGNGFAGRNNGSQAAPMVLNVTPEPAALALLALGGIAVLRRRS